MTWNDDIAFKRSMTGMIEHAIQAKLTAAFAPLALEIEDQSAKHAGHAGAQPGGETHFRVKIVSLSFSALSRVARQRRVYAVLADEFAAGLHALALETQTPDET